MKRCNSNRMIDYLVWVACLLIVGGCSAWADEVSNPGEKDSKMNNDDSDKYYYEMDKKHQNKLLENLKFIELGASLKDVIIILGKPTYDQKGYSKRGQFICRTLKYYVKIWRKGLVNEKHDRLIRLVFDSKDTLIEINSNVVLDDKRKEGNDHK